MISKEYQLPSGGIRKKDVKYGALVTFYCWERGRRLYGRIMGIDYARWSKPEAWCIIGKFGLSSFHINQIRPVSGVKVLTPEEMELKFGYSH